MTTARTVPVTVEMDGDELDAEDAWRMVRKHGLLRLGADSFVRFRYGDGFTSSRALALQAAMAVVPFLLALTGLAADIDQERPAQVIASTIQAVSPGSGEQDAIASAVTGDASSEEAGEVALSLGLGFALLAMVAADGAGRARAQPDLRDPTGSTGPVEVRSCGGADRRARRTARSRVPRPRRRRRLRRRDVTHYGWGDDAVIWWNIARWPTGLVLLVLSIAVMLDHAPRRRQPTLTWLALGAGIAVLLTMSATGLLAAYVHVGDSFGSTYGPLGGVFALLLWSLLSAIAFFYGAAVCAQLEAYRGGDHEPAYADPGRPHRSEVSG